MASILVVEDDAATRDGLVDLLRCEGHEVLCASRQDVAVRLLETRPVDLALLDVSLEQGTGFAVCAAAKSLAPQRPVIFLTASDDEYTTVAGLDLGADDYIAKPFRARELASRVRAVLRRSMGTARAVIELGPLEIDVAAAVVRKRGAEVFLSALEYRLLLMFAQHPGKLFTRDNVRGAIWDSAGEYASDNAINVLIKRVRDKIEDDPANPSIIVTVRGLGYKTGA